MTGITKREPPISWRPSKAARAKLARLVSETGLSRNDLLNQLVTGTDKRLGALEGSAAPPPHMSEEVRSNARLTRRVTVDRDKIAAFQRKAGMGGSGKK